jgi:hypothetical protein
MRATDCFFLFVCLLLLSICLRTLWLSSHERTYKSELRSLYPRECFLCLTTVPDRITSPGFVSRLRGLASLPSHQGLVLSVPWVFKKTGEAYTVPSGFAEIPKLLVYRCEDEGPGTKALAPLRNEEIPGSSALMFCDDDTFYHEKTFELLADAVSTNPYEAHSICSGDIRGYLGFGAVKELLMPLLSLDVPESCRTVDDTFFEESLAQLGIGVNQVEMPGCLLDCRMCSMDYLETFPINFLDKSGLTYQEVLTSNRRQKTTEVCVRQLREGMVS